MNMYLREDKRVNIDAYGGGKIAYIKHLLGHTDAWRTYKYLKVLRHYEYHYNALKIASNPILHFIHKFSAVYYKLKLSRTSARCNVNICRPNSVGYGFRATHVNGGIIINCESMGNYCTVNSGVVVGVKTSAVKAPVIGNNVELATGCKIIGNVVIGDNVIVAPNSVVVKDVEQNTVVSGVPAKFLKMR